MIRVSRFVRVTCDTEQYAAVRELRRRNRRIVELSARTVGSRRVVACLCYSLAAARKLRALGGAL